MNREIKTRPETNQELRVLVLDLQAKLDQQSQFINQLLEQIRLSRHQHFGTRSERCSLDQMALAFNEAEAAAEQAADDPQCDAADKIVATDSVVVPAHLRKCGGRKPLPPDLPRVEVIYTLEETSCDCAGCSGELTVIGEKVSE